MTPKYLHICETKHVFASKRSNCRHPYRISASNSLVFVYFPFCLGSRGMNFELFQRFCRPSVLTGQRTVPQEAHFKHFVKKTGTNVTIEFLIKNRQISFLY